MKIRSLIPVVAMLLTGCAGTYNSSVQFNPLEPIRVAVLPFGQVDHEGKFINPDAELLIDNVSIVSSELKQSPAEFVQELVETKLAGTNLDELSPALVDAQLSHHGFAPEDQYDYARLFATSPKELCTTLFSCDAVLYGKVTRWDRSYYGIQTVNSVGIELSLVSARDGKVLFHATAEDSDSRGITKGPTGFSDLVIEPIRGLNSKIIVELARNVVNKSLSPLYIKERPEFLSSSPPAIFASAHDAPNGAVSRAKPLTVVMLGSPHQQASFSIGDSIQRIPMIERTEGHYIGEYFPLSSDRFEEVSANVHLTDAYGRTTSQTLGRETLTLK